MFRWAINAARIIRPLATSSINSSRFIRSDIKPYSTKKYLFNINAPSITGTPLLSLLNNKSLLHIASQISPIQVRTVTKFSLKKGKRKSVKAALRRFYRLNWGGWIRPKCGRQKKLWKKSSRQKRRLRQHVTCNATQSTLLDKMVTKFWKRPKYYVDDPYAPYHTREEFPITRKQPIVRS